MSENEIKQIRRFDSESKYGLEEVPEGAFVLYDDFVNCVDDLLNSKFFLEAEISRLRSLASYEARLMREGSDVIDRLTAERDAAVADADRYRWLRSNCCMFYPSAEGSQYPEAYLVVTGYGDLRRDELIDKAIDAARAEGGV